MITIPRNLQEEVEEFLDYFLETESKLYILDDDLNGFYVLKTCENCHYPKSTSHAESEFFLSDELSTYLYGFSDSSYADTINQLLSENGLEKVNFSYTKYYHESCECYYSNFEIDYDAEMLIVICEYCGEIEVPFDDITDKWSDFECDCGAHYISDLIRIQKDEKRIAELTALLK